MAVVVARHRERRMFRLPRRNDRQLSLADRRRLARVSPVALPVLPRRRPESRPPELRALLVLAASRTDLDNGLDVITARIKCLGVALQRNSTGNQPL